MILEVILTTGAREKLEYDKHHPHSDILIILNGDTTAITKIE